MCLYLVPLFRLIPIFLLLLMTPNVSTAETPLSDSQKKSLEQGIKFGLAYGELVFAAAKNSAVKPADYTGQSPNNALEALGQNYKATFETQRAGVKVLDAALDLAIEPASLVGGPPGIVIGAVVGYAKNKAMGALSDEIDQNAKKYLAANLGKFNATTGLDYEALRATNDPQKIKEAIDNNGLLNDFKEKFENDTVAREAIEKAFIKNVLNTEKATLDQIANTNQDLAAAKDQITGIGKTLSAYTTKINGAVSSLEKRADSLEIAMNESRQSLHELTKHTEQNSHDLKIVGDVLFSQAPPAQKLTLLKAGFYADLPDEKRKNLEVYLNAEVKKEQFIKEIGNVVQVANGIASIAKNFGVNSPELEKAVNFASVGATAVTAYLSGNPVGAVVAVSSLFGGGAPDPEASRHAALMSYLQNQFAEVNRKLDQIIKLQVKTLEVLEQIAKQIEIVRGEMHARFDALDYKIETLIGLTSSMVYSGLNDCRVLEAQFNNEIKPEGLKLDTTKLDQLEKLSTVGQKQVVESCIHYLQNIFYIGTTVFSNFSTNPLAVRYADNTPGASYPVKEDLDRYKSAMQIFIENHYKKMYGLLESRAAKSDIPGAAALYWAWSVPSSSTVGSDKKMLMAKSSKEFCVKGTLLSNPHVGFLCTQDPG